MGHPWALHAQLGGAGLAGSLPPPTAILCWPALFLRKGSHCRLRAYCVLGCIGRFALRVSDAPECVLGVGGEDSRPPRGEG